jgi:hypothetical protein
MPRTALPSSSTKNRVDAGKAAPICAPASIVGVKNVKPSRTIDTENRDFRACRGTGSIG